MNKQQVLMADTSSELDKILARLRLLTVMLTQSDARNELDHGQSAELDMWLEALTLEAIDKADTLHDAIHNAEVTA